MLISVHIPKTGGNSFRSVLQAHFGDRMLLDYGDKPMSKDTESRTRQATAYRLKAQNLSDTYDCVHGHFLATKYAIPEQNNVFVVWFRNPVERVVSRYYYSQRTSEGRLPEGMSLEEFCELEHYQNLYAKYLWNFDLKAFRFVGITENYDRSLKVFKRLFNISSDEFRIGNRNPDKKVALPYDISSELTDLICRTNHQDYEIYREAVEINRRLERVYL